MSNVGLTEQQVQQVLNNPDFQLMAKKKSSLGRLFSILTIIMYVTYMVLLGVNPQLFATPVSAGSTTTWGIYLGVGVILFSIIITAIYVKKANGEFDTLTNRVIEDVKSNRL